MIQATSDFPVTCFGMLVDRLNGLYSGVFLYTPVNFQKRENGLKQSATRLYIIQPQLRTLSELTLKPEAERERERERSEG
jgi:hypothetical protein